MELYQHWAEATEATNEDAAQLKRDFKTHSRTSLHSLRFFAKVLSVGGSHRPVNQLDELIAWLSSHRSELPAEVENDQGCKGSGQRLEHNGTDYEEKLQSFDGSEDEDGLYYCGESSCWMSHDQYASQNVREYKEFGLDHRVKMLASARLANLFRKYHAKKTARLRWRGMEEFQGVSQALGYINDNVSPRAAQSHAEPLPSQAELHALFDYDGVSLTWSVSRGRIRKGKPVGKRVRLNGKDYIAGRLVHMHRLGIDPANATISYADGDPSNVAWSNLRVERLAAKSTTAGTRERTRKLDDSRYQSRFSINQKRYTLGEYDTEEQAETAYELAMRTFTRFA